MRIILRVFLLICVIGTAMGLKNVFAARLDGATVTNSGSTNTRGYLMKVRSDGTGTVQPYGPQAGAAQRLAITPSLATKLLNDAKAAKAANPSAPHCMKSASFGYRLTITYHGWTSPDLTCPGGAELQALLDDVKQIEQAGNVDTGIRRIHLPVNEPRRLPTEGSPSPSPSIDGQP